MILENTSRDIAARLDQPSAVVSRLPAGEQVGPLVSHDTSQSIGNALNFAGQAQAVVQSRAVSVPSTQAAQHAGQAGAELGEFVASSKSSFMSAVHITSLFAALAAWLGAIVAFGWLPGRRRPAAADVRVVAEREVAVEAVS